MSERQAKPRPEVVEFERVRHVLAGAVQSRSDPERVYQVRVLLEADILCSCPSMTLRGNLCAHAKELVRQLELKDFRRWVRDSAVVRTEPEESQ